MEIKDFILYDNVNISSTIRNIDLKRHSVADYIELYYIEQKSCIKNVWRILNEYY